MNDKDTTDQSAIEKQGLSDLPVAESVEGTVRGGIRPPPPKLPPDPPKPLSS